MDDNASPNIKATENTSQEEANYLAKLSDKEKIDFETAKTILGSSFNLKKSIGFTEQQK